MQLRVTVGEESAGDGRRELAVLSRNENEPDQEWTRNATGTLTAATDTPARFNETVWPPTDAERIPVDGFYEELVDVGFAYGPVFQGLRAAWRRGAEVFAEVALSEETAAEAAKFALHPALLDAALQTVGLLGDATSGLPFAWTGVRLHAVGATALRVRLSPAGDGGVQVLVADETGAPVATIDSLVTRPVPAEQLGGTKRRGSLYELTWAVLEEAAAPVSGSWTVVGPDAEKIADPLRRAGVDVSTCPSRRRPRARRRHRRWWCCRSPCRRPVPGRRRRRSRPARRCTVCWARSRHGWPTNASKAPGWSSSPAARSPRTGHRLIW